MSGNCGNLFGKKKIKREEVCDEDITVTLAMQQMPWSAIAVESSGKMVGAEDSKLWTLHNVEEQLKASQ